MPRKRDVDEESCLEREMTMDKCLEREMPRKKNAPTEK
jgi:hypothetical protein